MDRRDEIFFTLPGWFRSTTAPDNALGDENSLVAHENWHQYRYLEEQISAVRKAIKLAECKIATVPISSFDQLIAKAGFAKSVFYNTHPADPYLEECPENLEELFAYHLERDIKCLADLYERRPVAKNKMRAQERRSKAERRGEV